LTNFNAAGKSKRRTFTWRPACRAVSMLFTIARKDAAACFYAPAAKSMH
jgi:hypothetical protein